MSSMRCSTPAGICLGNPQIVGHPPYPPHDTARGLYLDSTKPRHGSLQCRKIILEIAEEVVHLIQKLANDVYMSTRTFNKAGRGSNSVRQHDQLSSSSSAIGE